MRSVRLAWKFLALTTASLSVQAATFGASAAYPHLEPQHAGLECRECHTLEPNRADIHKMPGHAACAGCHNFAAEAIDRAEAFCGGCHTSREPSQERPALFDFPKQHESRDFGDLFSHVAHKNAGTATRCEAPGTAAQSKCGDCHAPVRTSAGQKPEKQIEASHTVCFACHCENPRGYTAARKNLNPGRNDCAVCHVAHEPELTPLKNVNEFRHADHLFDTRPRKIDAGPVSHDPDILCVECHRTAAQSSHLDQIRQPEAATCNSCHIGKPGLPDPLPAEKLR
jgi:hypothetical protein